MRRTRRMRRHNKQGWIAGSLVGLLCTLMIFAAWWFDLSGFFTNEQRQAATPTISRRIPMSEMIKRTDVAAEHRWKLEDLYASQTDWDAEYNEVANLINKVSTFHQKLTNASTIRDCFVVNDELAHKMERLYVYANMRHHEDMAEPKYQALTDKVTKLSVRVSEATSYIVPEILSLSDEQIADLLKSSELADYRFSLEEMVREKQHVLSKAEEALLAQVGDVSRAAGHIFSMINNADMKFPKVKNDKGELVELTHSRYIEFLESPNREVRRHAFQAMYETYSKQKNTLAATLSANVSKNLFYAKARKYPSALEMSLFSDNISTAVYDNLIATMHEHLPLMHRYMKLRKKMLNVDELHMYDLFVPLVDELDTKISYEEAKTTISESLKPLGPTYVSVLNKGYNEGWIDVYENEGKRSGAYSWGAYGTHPYVLLNHKENLNSMFTLTHEMGHALHSYFSDEAQPYRYAQYTIFLAEVASTLNEALLMDHLLNTTNDVKQKMYLLTYYADQFRTTVFRQTMFAEFEKIIHEKAAAGEALTPQALSAIYYDLNKKYYGPEMVVDEDIAMEWARIPHFYTSFYVYKYATGFSAATSFAKQILDEGQPAVARYLGFLKSGGSDYSIEILKKAGVDMTSPEPIRQALSVFEEVISEMEKLNP